LLSENAAVRVNDDGKNIESVVNDLISEPKKLKNIEKNLSSLRNVFYWEEIIKKLVTAIDTNPTPYTKTKNEIQDFNFKSHATNGARLKTYAKKALRKGVGRSAKFAYQISKNYIYTSLSNKVPKKERQKAVFISHPLMRREHHLC
jgi:hypothetical protein